MHRFQEGARSLLVVLLILLFLVFSVEPLPSWATGLKSTSTSFFSFCVNGGDLVSTYYLMDLTNPIPGQSIMIEDYVQVSFLSPENEAFACLHLSGPSIPIIFLRDVALRYCRED